MSSKKSSKHLDSDRKETKASGESKKTGLMDGIVGGLSRRVNPPVVDGIVRGVSKNMNPDLVGGQMSRVDSCRIAIWKAKEAGLSLKGSIVASDAMFPSPDGLIAAADAGATAAIQPGGSVKDAEVIAAADEHKLAMCFTGVRHFLH